MEINSEADVDKLLDMGLDGYTIDSVQQGGNQTKVPVFIMNVQVLKTLNLFRDTPKDGRFTKLNGYYGFLIGKKESNNSPSFPLYLLTESTDSTEDSTLSFSNFTKIANIFLEANTDITLSELLETLFQYVTAENTDNLLTFIRLDKTTQLVPLFLEAPTFEQTDIEEFSKSLSLLKSVTGDTSQPLLPTSNGESWLVSNIKARLGDGLSEEITKELTDNKWRVISNTGGGDCFFLSLCQSGVSIHTLEDPSITINTEEPQCVNSIREFIANNITEDMYDTRKQIPSYEPHAPPSSAMNTLDSFKDYVKTSNYYADEMTISILQDRTNLYPIILNRDLNYTNTKPVIKCYSTNIRMDDLKQKQYVLLKHIEGGGGHYELIQFKKEQTDSWMSVFSTFDQLPKSIQALMTMDCIQS